MEALQRKHALFENSLEAQLQQVEEVERYAQQLTQRKHYDTDNIKKRSKAIQLRWVVTHFLYLKKSQLTVECGYNFFSSRKERLLEMSKARQRALEESVQLQKFLEDSYEVWQRKNKLFPLLEAIIITLLLCSSGLMQNYYLINVSLGNPLKSLFILMWIYSNFLSFDKVCSWLNEKKSVAQDENWREPINLQAKILKHQSFEAEILANSNSIEALTKVTAYQSNRPFHY